MDLSLAELERRYDTCEDETELSAVEEELAIRHGYTSSDAWYQAIAKSTPAEKTVYGISAEELKTRPFYLSSIDESLCGCCQHLDFAYMVTHRIEELEIDIGLLKDIAARERCASCRLLMATLRSSTEMVLQDDLADESLQVLLHSTPKNGDAFSLFDLALTLRPGQYRGIGIQKLAAEDSVNAFEGRVIDPNSIDVETPGHDNTGKASDDTSIFTPTYLIDVLDNCILETDEEAYPYLAQSYVTAPASASQQITAPFERLLAMLRGTSYYC
ncbi:hypothetical protein HII31_01198 [Pseudocercospora fuligena]|uniref:Uncharacterized protein n=1 Tax=Pseudocercospora fuligena TaxID=685502 RepID=A0A8H6RU35_9PEZI|nr:hypothetical protein HII31_01198 [Pseudocercospora fuligena]